MATLTKSLLPISGYTNQYYTYQCVVTENSYSVANNTSNVTITFSIKGPWAPSYYEWATNYGIIVDGAVKKTGSSSPYVSTSYVQLLTWTGDITHSSDGSKTINVGVYLYHNNTANYLPKQYTSSSPLTMGSVTLTTIARASQPSIITWPNTTQNIGDIGSPVTIHMNRASSSFTHTVRYAFGSLSGTIATSVGDNCGWTIPDSFYAQIPTATSGTGTVYCDTYNGSTFIGTKSVSFTTTVPGSVSPTVGTITLEPADINGQNILIQGKNKLTIKVSGCAAGTGSSIKSYTFSGPGISSTTTSTSVTSGGTISNTGTLTYTVTVTDNRGRASSQPAQITCHAWSTPSITLNSAYRVASTTSTTENDSGTYVRCSYNLSYSSVNSTNDVTVKILYKKNSASSWSSATALTDSKNTSGNYVLSGIDAASTYTVYATITDNYRGSSNSSKITIFSAERILNVRPSGSGIALGKMADTDNVLDSKWPIRSDDAENTMKNLTYKGTNVISSATNDTTANWGNQGNLGTVFYTSTGQITDQPSQYGFILNLTNGPSSSEVHQLWATQSSGSLLHRGGNASGWNGTWRTILDSANYKSFAFPQATTLYNSSGNAGTVTLSYAASNYTYLEIFYKDNNGNGHSCMKIYSPDGKKIDLSIIEASDTTASRTYIRRTMYTISGTTITPNATTSGYVQIDGTTVTQTFTGTNHLRITRVLGYA